MPETYCCISLGKRMVNTGNGDVTIDVYKRHGKRRTFKNTLSHQRTPHVNFLSARAIRDMNLTNANLRTKEINRPIRQNTLIIDEFIYSKSISRRVKVFTIATHSAGNHQH